VDAMVVDVLALEATAHCTYRSVDAMISLAAAATSSLLSVKFSGATATRLPLRRARNKGAALALSMCKSNVQGTELHLRRHEVCVAHRAGTACRVCTSLHSSTVSVVKRSVAVLHTAAVLLCVCARWGHPPSPVTPVACHTRSCSVALHPLLRVGGPRGMFTRHTRTARACVRCFQ
jgi:hypothetical protein